MDLACFGQLHRVTVALVHYFGDAKIHDFDEVFFIVVINEHDIAWFDVPVQHIVLVGMTQGNASLDENVDRSQGLQIRFCIKQLFQTDSIQVVHDHVWLVFVDAEVKNCQYILMVEAAGSVGLVLEAPEGLGTGNQVLVQHFQGHDLVHHPLASLINRAHATSANYFENFVGIVEDCAHPAVLPYCDEHGLIFGADPQTARVLFSADQA
jgi:hypothetical protein